MEEYLASSFQGESICLWPGDADSICFRPADLTGVDDLLGEFGVRRNLGGSSGIDISPIKNEDVLMMIQTLRGKAPVPRNSASKRRKMQSMKVARALDNLSSIMGTPTRLSISRPKSATKLISPESPKQQSAKKVYESEIHYLFNVAGITSPFMITPPPNSRARQVRPRAVHLSSIEDGDLAYGLLMCDDNIASASLKENVKTPNIMRSQMATQPSVKKSAVKLNLKVNSSSPPRATSSPPPSKQIPRTPTAAPATSTAVPRSIPRLDVKVANNSAKKVVTTSVTTKSPRASIGFKDANALASEGFHSPSSPRRPLQSSLKPPASASRIPKSPGRPKTPSARIDDFAAIENEPQMELPTGKQLPRTPLLQKSSQSPPVSSALKTLAVATSPRSPLRQLTNTPTSTMPKTASERARLVSSPTNTRLSKSPIGLSSSQTPKAVNSATRPPNSEKKTASVVPDSCGKKILNFDENKENSKSYNNISVPSVSSKEINCVQLSEEFDFNIDSYVTKSTVSKPIRFSEEERALLDAMSSMTSRASSSTSSVTPPAAAIEDAAFFSSVMQSCDNILAQLDAAVSKGPIRSPIKA